MASAQGKNAWRTALGIVLALGLLLYLPAIRARFWLDDYAQMAMVKGTFPAPRGPLDLYDFVGDGDRVLLVQRGILPWWTDSHLKLRFFRPLTSAILFEEHRWLGDNPLPMHLVSFAWWMAAVIAARALYRRLFSPRVVWIATAFFGLSRCHAQPLAWTANREVLISTTFGLLALGAHLRWRTEASFKHALLATALFAMSLAGGEYGICFGGYVLALELSRRDAALGRRLLGLSTFLVPALAYLAVRAALGYGAAGTGFYYDPTRDPGQFLLAAPRRLVTLLIDGWLTLDADGWAAEGSAWWLAAVFVLAAAVLVSPFRRVIAAQSDERQAATRWLLPGSVLALVPVLAVAPLTRLIGVSVLGLAPIVAMIVDHAWFVEPLETGRAGQRLRLAAVLMGFLHFVHGPVTSWLAARDQHATADSFAARAAWLHDHVADPTQAEFIVGRAGWESALFEPFAIEPNGQPPLRWRVLVLAWHALVLRADARTIDVIVPHGARFFPAGPIDLFRSETNPLLTGDEVSVPGMVATVVDAGDVGAARLRFRFDRDLEDPSLTWIAEVQGAYRESPPPKPGFGAQLDP